MIENTRHTKEKNMLTTTKWKLYYKSLYSTSLRIRWTSSDITLIFSRFITTSSSALPSASLPVICTRFGSMRYAYKLWYLQIVFPPPTAVQSISAVREDDVLEMKRASSENLSWRNIIFVFDGLKDGNRSLYNLTGSEIEREPRAMATLYASLCIGVDRISSTLSRGTGRGTKQLWG